MRWLRSDAVHRPAQALRGVWLKFPLSRSHAPQRLRNAENEGFYNENTTFRTKRHPEEPLTI